MTLNNPENAIYTYTARSETGNHDAMLEDLVFIARFPLAQPQMMCPITEYEILVKPGLFLQTFHTCAKFSFITRKENRIHNSKIQVYHFLAIGTEDMFYRYIHDNLF